MKILTNGNLKVIVYDDKKKKAFEAHGFKEAEPKKKPAEKKDEKGED